MIVADVDNDTGESGNKENVMKKKKIALISDEVDFVRGKKNVEGKTKKIKTDSDNIFREVDTEKPIVKQAKSKDDSDVGKPLDELSYKKLFPGMLILGVVSEISEVDVMVNLPGGLTGFIKGTDISEEFNKVLSGSTDSDDEEMETEQPDIDICDMISVGQYLVCSVVEVTSVNKSKRVNLTTRPEHTNKHVTLPNIKKNMMFQGVIQSVEDYGYIVNIGVNGVKAFLNKAEKVLKECDIVLVAVKSATDSNIILDLYDTACKPLTDKAITTFTSLLPGHLINVHVKKRAVNGVRCSFLNGFQGVLPTMHLKDLYGPKTISDVYPVKRKLTARVLLINPEKKYVVLSMLDSIRNLEVPGAVYRKGDLVEEVEVVKTTKRGVYISLGQDVTGFCHISKLQDKELEKINANFKEGTKHKVRVMGFRLLDNLLQLSLRQSDISKPFLSYNDITPCTVVMATVVSIEDFGLVVKLADNIRGCVPKLHMADIRIKNPAMKFKENQKVKAKVMTVDPKKRRLQLTLKRSIVKNSTANVTSYETLEKDQHITGWVAAIKDFGIIMNFTANIRGLVHSSDISNVPITEVDINKLYKLGQVLSCRVIHVNPQKEKLSLSLNLIQELKEDTSNIENKKWARKGQIHSCTVLSNKTDGLAIRLSTTNEEAFLPVEHLSDHPSLYQPKLLNLKSGSKIDKVMIVSKKSTKIIVTAKLSILQWVEGVKEIPKISDLSVGDLVPGYVKDFQDYGCFIELANGLVGLCPKACLDDNFVNNPKDLYNLGDSVICKITNIDPDKERLLVSVKVSDVGKDLSMAGWKLLDLYFTELDTFGGCQDVGSVVECHVDRATERGYGVKVGDTQGFALTENSDPGLKVGGSVKGVVLDYDPISKLYIVNMKDDFVSLIEGRGKRKKLTDSEEVSVTVVLVKEEFLVVMVPSHGYRFGYLHKKVHVSDRRQTLGKLKSGEECKVVVSKAKKGKPLLLSCIPTEAANPKNESRKRKRSDEETVKKFEDVKIGEIYEITVKSVKSLQLNVQLGRKINGRVHISEVTDSPKSGENPMAEFKHGDKLHAKLIGFRHSKTHRYLPITRTDYVRSIAEFSLKDSAIKSNKIREYSEDEKVDETRDLIKTLVVGQEITGYVRSIDSNGFVWISLTPGVEARLYHTLTSPDKEEVERWTERFTIGQSITATVFTVRDNRIDVSLAGPLAVESKLWGVVKGKIPGVGLKLQISARDWAIAPLTELQDNYSKDPLSKFKEDELVHCIVIEAPTETNKRIVVSLRKSRISQRWKKAVGGRKVVHPIISTREDLNVGSIYHGFIKSTTPTAGIYVALGHSVTGRVLLKNMSDNFLKNWQPMFPLGKLVKVFIISIDPKIELSMKISDFKKAQKEVEAEEEGEEMVQKCLDDILLEKYQGSDDEEEEEEEEDSGDESVEEVDDAPKIVFTLKSKTADEKAPGGLKISELLENEAEEEDEEEEETEDKTEEADEKKGKSFLKRDKRRKKEEAEEELKKIELRSNSSTLETEDDFEKEVASKPDSSASWVCYMAYWLGSGNADKARLTAKRALDTINYRLEEEKLNVWSALFNLENSFGTQDSLMKCCKEAASVNDSKAVFMRLAAVLDKSKKFEELDDIYNSVLLKKHKKSRKVWCTYGTSLAEQNNLDSMRDLFIKALKSLPKHKHIRTISHFAQLEYKLGDPNRGSTMFENVLNSYPTRLDLWSVYLDKTIALNDDEQSRLLLERVIGLKLPLKKMKFFYKRYIDFETSRGTEVQLDEIKEKAKNYLESTVE